MNDLLTQGNAPTRLTLLLEAAAADPSAPDKDPLWPELVQGLATIWQGEATISSGMDLMFTESRPRARDAVVSSFAKVALERSGELTPAQQQKLTEYFIDLHGKLPAYQKREVEAAARKIGGNDVADLLQGKSPDNLEIHREYHQALEDNQKRSQHNDETGSSTSDSSGRVRGGAAAARTMPATGRRAVANHAPSPPRARAAEPPAPPPAPAAAAEAEPDAASPPPSKGSWLEGNIYRFRLDDVRKCPPPSVAGGARIGAVVRVTSKVDEVFVAPRDVKLESGGVILDSAILGKAPGGCGPLLTPKSLRAGKTADGVVVFDLPPGFNPEGRPVKITYQPTRWGGARRVEALLPPG